MMIEVNKIINLIIIQQVTYHKADFRIDTEKDQNCKSNK